MEIVKSNNEILIELSSYINIAKINITIADGIVDITNIIIDMSDGWMPLYSSIIINNEVKSMPLKLNSSTNIEFQPPVGCNKIMIIGYNFNKIQSISIFKEESSVADYIINYGRTTITTNGETISFNKPYSNNNYIFLQLYLFNNEYMIEVPYEVLEKDKSYFKIRAVKLNGVLEWATLGV